MRGVCACEAALRLRRRAKQESGIAYCQVSGSSFLKTEAQSAAFFGGAETPTWNGTCPDCHREWENIEIVWLLVHVRCDARCDLLCHDLVPA